jgi:hypothetical protein
LFHGVPPETPSSFGRIRKEVPFQHSGPPATPSTKHRQSLTVPSPSFPKTTPRSESQALLTSSPNIQDGANQSSECSGGISNSNIGLCFNTDLFVAFPSTHEICLLTPRGCRPDHESNLRTQHLHLRRAPLNAPNPSPLQLSRIQLPPDPPKNLQLWNLHRLQVNRPPARAQRSTNAQATPTLLPLPVQESRRPNLCQSFEIPWSRNSQGA